MLTPASSVPRPQLSSYPIDIVVLDASTGDETVEAGLRALARAGHAVDRFTQDGDRPSQPLKSAGEFLAGAVARSRDGGRDLLVLLAAFTISPGVIARLQEALARDPMFGSAQPRFADADGRLLPPSPNGFPPRADAMVQRSEAIADALAWPGRPNEEVVPELLAACLLIRHRVLAIELDLQDGPSPAVLLRGLLTRARRRGFRGVIVHDAVITAPLDAWQIYPAPAPGEYMALQTRFPEMSRVDAGVRTSLRARFEWQMTGARSRPRRLVIDGRGVNARHDGTAYCMLGLLSGLRDLAHDWQITLLALPATIEFHNLAMRFPTLALATAPPSTPGTAALLPHQPFTMAALHDLHALAPVQAVLMLDTIAWDVIYPAEIDLEPIWRFAAARSDRLLYISHFSQARFNARFPVNASQDVVYLSLARDDYVEPEYLGRPRGDKLVVLGNSLDHKGIQEALQALAPAFPDREIVALGIRAFGSSNVRCVEGGSLEAGALHALVAEAGAVIYPSYYEGFGLPVAQALAYGRAVIVRASDLWTELAAVCNLPGTLIPFEGSDALVARTREVLAGDTSRPLAFGTALGPNDVSPSWSSAASRVLQSLEASLGGIDGSAWLQRETFFRAAAAL